ncbi:MAG: energy transducer TonB [Candidatus Methylomirabilia bacterium]
MFSLEPVTVTARSPVIPPRYKDVTKPAYPEAARVREQEGTVVLLVKVRPDGSVGEVKIRQTSEERLLDQAAVSAAWKWAFIPARRGPKSVEAWVEVSVKFELE